MTLLKQLALVAIAACTLSLLSASSCASTAAKENQEMPELTPEQLAGMDENEVAEYYAERAAKRAKIREKEEEKAGVSLVSGLHSVEKRERMGDVNHRLKDDSTNAVFPWQSKDAHRSESLLGRQSAVYDW